MTAAVKEGVRLPPTPRAEWAYFFDVDGTLVELLDHPGDVVLEAELLNDLRALHAATGGAVALVSGRSVADLNRLFPGLVLPAAGQHGTERRDASGALFTYEVDPRIEAARLGLTRAAGEHPGLFVEDKGASLALHYRRAPQLAPLAEQLIAIAHGQLGSDYRVLAGKQVIEVVPAGRDKGWAVLEFMEEEPFRGRKPVFVGDDVTDEHGFAAVNGLRGLTVKVGSGRSVARWRLASVRDVLAWLRSVAG